MKKSKSRRPAPKKSKLKARRNANARARRAEKKAADIKLADQVEVELLADTHIGGHGLPRGLFNIMLGAPRRAVSFGDFLRTTRPLPARTYTMPLRQYQLPTRGLTGGGYPIDPAIAAAWRAAA